MADGKYNENHSICFRLITKAKADPTIVDLNGKNAGEIMHSAAMEKINKLTTIPESASPRLK